MSATILPWTQRALTLQVEVKSEHTLAKTSLKAVSKDSCKRQIVNVFMHAKKFLKAIESKIMKRHTSNTLVSKSTTKYNHYKMAKFIVLETVLIQFARFVKLRASSPSQCLHAQTDSGQQIQEV